MSAAALNSKSHRSPDAAAAVEELPGNVVALKARTTPRSSLIAKGLGTFVATVTPPLVILAVLLLIWEISASGAKSGLPPPSRI